MRKGFGKTVTRNPFQGSISGPFGAPKTHETFPAISIVQFVPETALGWQNGQINPQSAGRARPTKTGILDLYLLIFSYLLLLLGNSKDLLP